MAASSVLAGVPRLWEKVVPEARDQDWDPNLPDRYRQDIGLQSNAEVIGDVLVEFSGFISGALETGLKCW